MTSILAKVILITILLNVPSGDGKCRLPFDWLGSWHHLGYDDPLNITEAGIDKKGTCFQQLENNHDMKKSKFGQFIMKEEKGCLKCLIIYQKHFNVLQYRESDCDYKENLLTRGDGLISLCQDIPGDAVMYSMIRVMSRPVECPLQGPYRLAYGKGGADKQCSHPPSLMDSCSDNSVIQVKYQACPDIQGSESKVERMTCVAKWKEGNKRYFVALVSSRQSKWLEHQERYQCFLYEDISNKMKMAQGQFTSSCQGLWSVLEGSRTFSLEKLTKPEACTLPHFLSRSPRWKSMNQNLSLHLDDDFKSFSFMKSGTILEQAVCHSSEIDSSRKKAQVIAHVKTGCSSGFLCYTFKQLNENLLEATFGITSNHPEEACEHFYFSPNTWTVSIIVAENSSSPCPFSGSYKVDGQPNKILQTLDAMEPKHLVQPEEKDTKVLPVDNCSTFIQAGCSHSHSLELETLCTDFQLPKKQSLRCHGMWNSRSELTRLILSDFSQAYYCLEYIEKDGVVEGSLLKGECNHSPQINISSTGPCILPLRSNDNMPSGSSYLSRLVTIWSFVILEKLF